MKGVIAVCDVERLDDLERSKQEALREKEKMKYGAVSSRKKDLWYKQVTSSSTSTSASPTSSLLIASKENDHGMFEKNLNTIPSSSSSSSSLNIEKTVSEKKLSSDNIRETRPRHKSETATNQPSEATQTLSRAVASLLFSLSSFGVEFLQLPEEGQKSIWRGIETFGKGATVFLFFSCIDIIYLFCVSASSSFVFICFKI